MRLAIVVCAAALPVAAHTDLGAMTKAERAAFGSEIRAFLMDEPLIARQALAPPNYAALANRDIANTDLALIASLHADLLGDADIALFVAPDCGTCADAQNELQAISDSSGATFKLHDMASDAGRTLARQLQMDAAPFYVMPDRILRGHMPQIVLTRYLSR